MPIDWFTVVAQIINFLILVWLLKRFLYKPILDAIDDREKRIATQLTDAEEKSAEALREREDFRRKNEEIEQNRAGLEKQAIDAANLERQRLFAEVRKSADSLRANRQAALRNERQRLIEEIKRWTQKEVFEISRKVLVDLADLKLEERIGAVFLHRLRTLNDIEKHRLVAAIKSSTESIHVRSAFELPQTVQNDIETAINEVCTLETRPQFDIAPEVVSGVELSVYGQKVAWSITEYLTSLEERVNETLHIEPEANGKSEAQNEPESASLNE